jgi:sec-independent protein translocase protein TatC
MSADKPDKDMTPENELAPGDDITNVDQPPDIIPDDDAADYGLKDELDDEVEASRAPLLSHLIELRRRLIVSLAAIVIGFLICLMFSRQLYDLLAVPFIDAYREHAGEDAEFQYRQLEFIFARLKLALIAGTMMAFPVVAREVYMFIAPGLYKNERGAVLPFLVAMPFLFLAGLALVYFFIMPFVINFYLSMEQSTGAGQQVGYTLVVFVKDYLDLISTLMVAFGFAFQLPVVLTLLSMAGIVSEKFLADNRRYAVVIGFAAAAFLTPADPFSFVAMGLIIWGLYEISIIAVRVTGARRRKREEAETV